MEFTNNFAVFDMRCAFERDMVRRKGTKVFRKRGIIGLCEICGEDFDKVRGNQRVCPECRVEQRRTEIREAVRRGRASKKKNDERNTDDVRDPWTRLMIAMLFNAKDEGDVEWAEDNRELFSLAILGRRMDG